MASSLEAKGEDLLSPHSRPGPLTASNTLVGSRLIRVSRKWSLQEYADRHVLVYGTGNIVDGQWPERNIHSDAEAARREGLAGAVASAPQIIALIMRMMALSFGSPWMFGGSIDVKMIKPLLVDTLVTTWGEVTSLEARHGDSDKTFVKVLCEVRAELLDGVPVMVGVTSVQLPVSPAR